MTGVYLVYDVVVMKWLVSDKILFWTLLWPPRTQERGRRRGVSGEMNNVQSFSDEKKDWKRGAWSLNAWRRWNDDKMGTRFIKWSLLEISFAEIFFKPFWPWSQLWSLKYGLRGPGTSIFLWRIIFQFFQTKILHKSLNYWLSLTTFLPLK